MAASPENTELTEDFARLWVANQRRVYGFLRMTLPAEGDVDEVFQETALVLWRKHAEFTPGTDFAAWAMAVARFQVLAYQKRRVGRSVSFSDELVEQLLTDAVQLARQTDDRVQALRDCLAQLNPWQRQLIQWRYEDGANARFLADRLGRSLATAYRLLDAIHVALFNCIRSKLPAES